MTENILYNGFESPVLTKEERFRIDLLRWSAALEDKIKIIKDMRDDALENGDTELGHIYDKWLNEVRDE